MHFEDRITDWVKDRAPRAAWKEGRGPAALLHCGDPNAEYAAIKNGAALAPLPGWAHLLAEGPDTVDYFHRRLTQSIKALALGSGARALLLGGDGRMQGDFAIWRGDEAAILATRREHADAAFDLLEKYVLMDNVEMTRFWTMEPLVALVGPRAPGILAALMDPRPDAQKLANDPWAAWFTVNLAGLPCRVFGDGRYGIPYYHLSIPPMAAEALLAVLAGACSQTDAHPFDGLAGEWALELMRIESGAARFGRDTDEKTIPLEAALEEAINFNKGCYPGQEILARIRNLGHPARALARFSLPEESIAPKGAAVKIGVDEAGAVTSSISWPGLGRTEGLASLKWDYRDAKEAMISTDAGDKKAELRPAGDRQPEGSQRGPK